MLRVEKVDIAGYLEYPSENNQKTGFYLSLGEKFGEDFEQDCYIVHNSGRILARYTAAVNRRIKGRGSSSFGQIGLFDVVDDYEVFSFVLHDAGKRFNQRNVEGILFPFYRSTWHDYRFSSSGTPDFKFFLDRNDPQHYSEFTNRYGFSEKKLYRSTFSRNIEGLIDKYEHIDTKLENGNINVKSGNDMSMNECFEIIYRLSIEGFKGNHFYADISFEEFYAMYSPVMKYLDPAFLTIAFVGIEPAGFLFSMPDYGPDGTAKGLILKSSAVSSNFRGLGIYTLLVKGHALESLKRGYDHLVYAFYYIDNPSGKVIAGTDNLDKNYELYLLETV